jgi:ribosomal protein S18 acetylase RimI-like enzyme
MAQAEVTLRIAEHADAHFVRSVCADSRPELRMLPSDVLDLQLAAQSAQYQAAYPDAQDQLICAAGEPVGRCWTNRSEHELRLLDITVLSSRRGHGIGRAVLSDLCAQAAATAVPLRLTVWHANTAAHRLYERLGFRDTTEANGYLSMEWTAHAEPMAGSSSPS